MSFPTVKFTLPSSDLFIFPPSNDPRTLPPPLPGSTSNAPPISIPDSWYSTALDARVPITIACVYAVTVQGLNAYNRSRGNKPWPISKTTGFFAFVVAHNIFLAVYSAWTFVGMFSALQNSLESWTGPRGLAGTIDSLCKVHGGPGLENSVTYNPKTSSWNSESASAFIVTDSGLPDSTVAGRLWNEGLAFYGWFFYLSKFYEVLDTLIILAKGKRSSTLQTYHHAGAMMCMWAGIRYMSPPIWMFVFVNSGIHALMYTYYTLTAFNVPIPQSLKRSLTSLQIVQFLVGSTYAAIHSFISYTVPVQVPDQIQYNSKTATSALSTTASVISSAGLEGLGSIVKKLLFRAAGEAGLAENVPSSVGGEILASHGSPLLHTEYKTVSCIDTSGQTFAIWFNVLYLTPLTALFVRFFVKSYLRRTSGQKSGAKHVAAEKAGSDALKGVERELNGNANGSANGHTNGHANGYANGHANGVAKMNGTNGNANGKH